MMECKSSLNFEKGCIDYTVEVTEDVKLHCMFCGHKIKKWRGMCKKCRSPYVYFKTGNQIEMIALDKGESK